MREIEMVPWEYVLERSNVTYISLFFAAKTLVTIFLLFDYKSNYILVS